MKNKYVAVGLVLLGCVQMAGDLFNMPVLKGLGQATNASPAPKVFTSQKGYETFSKRFYFKITGLDNAEHKVEITPQNYQNLKGPYNRRNMYGAAISYSPVLVSSDFTRNMFYSVAQYGLSQDCSLLDEMKISYDKSKAIELIIEDRKPSLVPSHWQTRFKFND